MKNFALSPGCKNTLMACAVACAAFVLSRALTPEKHQATSAGARTTPAQLSKGRTTMLRERTDVSPAPKREHPDLNSEVVLESEAEDLEEIVDVTSLMQVQQHLEELDREDSEPTELKEALLRRWATDDPVSAAAWTKQLPTGPWRKAAERQLTLGWAA